MIETRKQRPFWPEWACDETVHTLDDPDMRCPFCRIAEMQMTIDAFERHTVAAATADEMADRIADLERIKKIAESLLMPSQIDCECADRWNVLADLLEQNDQNDE